MVRNAKLVGQSIISYLQKKGYPEVMPGMLILTHCTCIRACVRAAALRNIPTLERVSRPSNENPANLSTLIVNEIENCKAEVNPPSFLLPSSLRRLPCTS